MSIIDDIKNTCQPTLFVTGASGHLGRAAIKWLIGRHSGRIIAGSRSPEKLLDVSVRGVETRHVDFDKPETLINVFADVDRLLLVSTNSVDEPGKCVRQLRDVLAAARGSGVGHVVFTSFANAVPGSVLALAPDYHAMERLVMNCEIGCTILRNNYYAENLLPGLLGALKSGEGKWYAAAGDGAASYVARDDCAATAAAVLASGFKGRWTLDVTGPESLTHAQIASAASAITGIPLEYVPVSKEEYVEGMKLAGFPDSVAQMHATFYEAISEGELDIVSPTVKEIVGEKPQSMQAFLAERL